MILFERTLNGGPQVVHKFDNGYGASVICHEFSYGGTAGLKEPAVLKFRNGTDDFSLCYDTEITDDVLGYLTEEDVVELLERIEKL